MKKKNRIDLSSAIPGQTLSQTNTNANANINANANVPTLSSTLA